jgi:hypothetical protein
MNSPTVHAWDIREANRLPAHSATYPSPPSICSINNSASVVFTP